MSVKILIHYNLEEAVSGVTSGVHDRFRYLSEYQVIDSDVNDGCLHTLTLKSDKDVFINVTVSSRERTSLSKRYLNIHYTTQSEDQLAHEIFLKLMEYIPLVEENKEKANVHIYDQQLNILEKVMPVVLSNLNHSYEIEDCDVENRFTYFSIPASKKFCWVFHLAKNQQEVDDIEMEREFLNSSEAIICINCENENPENVAKSLIKEIRKYLFTNEIAQKKVPSMWEEF